MSDVFLKMVKTVAVAAILGGLAIGLLRKVIPDPFAFGTGFFVLFATMFPLNKQFAENAGKTYGLGRHIAVNLLCAFLAATLTALLDKLF
jgi:hypothetical protein